MAPVLVVLVAIFFASGSVLISTADARSKIGGKSFRSTPTTAPAPKAAPATTATKSGGFGKALAGGLLGGAIGGMLFGSMFGAGGSGMGLLPILLLAGVAYFLYRKFTKAAQPGYSPGGNFGSFPGQTGGFGQSMSGGTTAETSPPQPPPGSTATVAHGIEQIRHNDPGFDANYFKEVASDVFFQVQAGWMRRDLDSYSHLLGEELAAEYAEHFAEMREQGIINKLESIAVRKVEISDAGSTGKEDFITVLFTANLLDYTVNDTTGDLIEGSMTEPVKFAEEWTWARPLRTENWKLEGIKLANQ
jgi:predicted lipid-binding transport protein (Tim44 family)